MFIIFYAFLFIILEILLVKDLKFTAFGIGYNDGIIDVNIAGGRGFDRLFDSIFARLALGGKKTSDCLALTRADSYIIVDLDNGGVAGYVEKLVLIRKEERRLKLRWVVALFLLLDTPQAPQT